MAGFARSSFGLTFISWDDDNIHELNERLFKLSRLRKYKSKADLWIGIGCLRNSGRLVDSIVYSNAKWIYNQALEDETKISFEGLNRGTPMRLGRARWRNEFCPCGSGLKHKKCCGRNY